MAEPNATKSDESTNETLSHRYSVSLVTQGKHRFFTLTMPSDILAGTSFVTTRNEDPVAGFQRVLDKQRAQQIADYVDSGLGTIPNSVVLSAQADADLKVIGGGKTIEFRAARKAFLVLDGQHRIFGFSLAKTRMRVPVVIYNNLSKRDESRLFIDINTKQRPVPNELLLDIKKLAEYETDAERLIGEVYDLFHSEPSSPLFGLMSPSSRASGKITRVTFYAALKPLFSTFENQDGQRVYDALQAYIRAFVEGCSALKAKDSITNPTVFRAMIQFFPEVGERVKDRYKAYTADNFSSVLNPLFQKLKPSEILRPARSHVELLEVFSKSLKQNFTL